MPEATLKFSLPDEDEEFKDALNGRTYQIIIFDIVNKILRTKHKKLSKKAEETYNKINEEVWQLLKDHNLDGEF